MKEALKSNKPVFITVCHLIKDWSYSSNNIKTLVQKDGELLLSFQKKYPEIDGFIFKDVFLEVSNNTMCYIEIYSK